jgi:acetyl-CoA acetyltransferase
METMASVVGIGALPVGRYADVLEHEMLLKALIEAMSDAGLSKHDIDALVFCLPRPYAEQRYFGTFMAGYLEIPIEDTLLEVLGNGMTGGLAFDIAVDRVATGKAKVAVALGVNRELHVPTREHMHLSMRAVGDVDFHVPFGVTPIAWYAFNATRYMHDYGLTREITVEDVLNARPIVRPLGLLDVPPRSDGAVAIVVARPDIARSLGRGVDVVGRGFYHEGIHQVSSRPRDLTTFESAQIASGKAYKSAGITAADLVFVAV